MRLLLFPVLALFVVGCTTSQRASLAYPPERIAIIVLRNTEDETVTQKLRDNFPPMFRLLVANDPELQKPDIAATAAWCDIFTSRGLEAVWKRSFLTPDEQPNHG